MDPETMRSLAANWAETGRIDMRDFWLAVAELCERLDGILKGRSDG